MKIVAIAKKLSHEGDHLHEGNFFVGQVKTFFAGGSSGLDAVSGIKDTLTNELSNAVSNKLAEVIGNVTNNIPTGLINDLQSSLSNVLSQAVNASIGDQLAHGLSDLSGDELAAKAGRLSGSALADLEGNPIESANAIVGQLQGLLDSAELSNAVDETLTRYSTDLGGDYNAIVSACGSFISNGAMSELTDVATDAIGNLGKPLSNLLDGSLGDQITDVMGSALGSSFKNSLASGGKIIIGGSNLLGSIPSLGGLGKTTILGEGGMLMGAGKKMIAMAEGKLSFAGGLSLSASGLIGGSGSSAFSLGPSGLSIGGKSLSKLMAPEPQNKETNHILELADANSLITMDSASPNTVTIPPDDDVAFELGDTINIIQVGSGQTSIAPGSGVQLYSGNSYRKISSQYSKVTLVKKAANQWILYGDLSA